RLTPVTTCRHPLPVVSFAGPRAACVAGRAGRAASHHSGWVPGRGQCWHGTCIRSVQRSSSSGKARHALSSTPRKETTIMAALTLAEWRARPLEQVHFAAQAALGAVEVQGNPRLQACVAATATGDLHQCLAQGPYIAAVRRLARGMAVHGTAAPGC